MKALYLQIRLKTYALRCVNLHKNLPKSEVAKIIGNQLLRSAFSTAANYRAACNAQTKKSFIAKLSIAFEEIDETAFWIEMIEATKLLPLSKLNLIHAEAIELTKIIASSRKTAIKRLKNTENNIQ
jgi:four helix bundle protein